MLEYFVCHTQITSYHQDSCTFCNFKEDRLYNLFGCFNYVDLNYPLINLMLCDECCNILLTVPSKKELAVLKYFVKVYKKTKSGNDRMTRSIHEKTLLKAYRIYKNT